MTMWQRLGSILIVGLLLSAGCSGATEVRDAPYEYLAPVRDIDVFFGLLEAAEEELATALATKDEVRASCHARPLNETRADYLKHLRRYNAYKKRAAELALVLLDADDPYFGDMLFENRPVDRLDGLTLEETLVVLPITVQVGEDHQSQINNMTISEWQMWAC